MASDTSSTPPSAFPPDWQRRCTICPRGCGVDRTATTGFCRAPGELVVASAGPHFGEEAPLVGSGGSGTIFLCGCNLQCVFCQNYDISHQVRGEGLALDALVRLMLALERRGCENVNFVTPTHYAPALADAIRRARREGLAVPIVWNCGGYEKLESLQALEGLVEIYMPDVKFFDPGASERYLDAPDYGERVRIAVVEMHRQVGDLEIRDGVATGGLLVRHLVMPGYREDSLAILDFLAREVSPATYVNVMAQYHPCGDAVRYEEIATRPLAKDIAAAKAAALEKGLRLDTR